MMEPPQYERKHYPIAKAMSKLSVSLDKICEVENVRVDTHSHDYDSNM